MQVIDWSVETRPLKEATRNIVAKRSSKNKEFLLVMPGSIGRDIEHLLEKGVATADSQWLVVERNKKVLDTFQQRNLLSKDKVDYHRNEFSKISSLSKPDFAWFDLCGNLTRADAIWIKEQLPISSDLDLFFTFSTSTRGNQFIDNCRKMLFDSYPDQMKDTIKNQLRHKLLSIPKRYFAIIATHWHLLRHLLPSARTHCYLYQDTNVSMILYHLAGFTNKVDHFAANEFDRLLGLRTISRDEVVTSILSAQSDKEIKLVRKLVKEYRLQESGGRGFTKKLQQEVEEIRLKRQQAIFS